MRKEVTLRDGTTKSSHPCGRLLLDEKVYPIEENTDAAGVLRVNCMQPAQGTQEARSGWAKVYHSGQCSTCESAWFTAWVNLGRWFAVARTRCKPNTPKRLLSVALESVDGTPNLEFVDAASVANMARLQRG